MADEIKPSTPAPHPAPRMGRPDGGRRPGGRGRPRRPDDLEALGLKETVVAINRVAKVVKGGKRFSFGALVVVGDGKGSVGCGLGKAKDVQFSIQKGSQRARKSMIKFAIVEETIPHEVVGRWGAGKVWMKPAAPGTGVIAGGGVRAVLEAAGVKNVLTKSLGSSNNFSVIYATMQALRGLRTREDIMKLRGRG
ncbi:MAG: 30S ribosomal protein S5 [Elusimicrobiota bacterium]